MEGHENVGAGRVVGMTRMVGSGSDTHNEKPGDKRSSAASLTLGGEFTRRAALVVHAGDEKLPRFLLRR